MWLLPEGFLVIFAFTKSSAVAEWYTVGAVLLFCSSVVVLYCFAGMSLRFRYGGGTRRFSSLRPEFLHGLVRVLEVRASAAVRRVVYAFGRFFVFLIFCLHISTRGVYFGPPFFRRVFEVRGSSNSLLSRLIAPNARETIWES